MAGLGRNGTNGFRAQMPFRILFLSFLRRQISAGAP